MKKKIVKRTIKYVIPAGCGYSPNDLSNGQHIIKWGYGIGLLQFFRNKNNRQNGIEIQIRL